MMDRLFNQLDSGFIFTGVALACWYYLQVHGASIWASQISLLNSVPAAGFLWIGLGPLIGYILYGCLQYCIDTMPMFASFRAKYKVQPAYVPDNAAYWNAAKIGARNFILLGLPYAALLSWIVCPLRGSDVSAEIPGPITWLWQFAVFVLCEEFFFFYSHKLLHHKSVYKYVHKFHHEYKAPFGIAAIYAEPSEHFLSNMFPVSAGPLLCGSHPIVAGFWSTFAILVTMTSHSGYHVPGFPNPRYHDWHHENFDENYGVLGILDSWYGSSTKFWATIAKEREVAAAAKEAKPKNE